MSESAAVIIGGTDGPTAVYLPGGAGISARSSTVTQCIVLLAVLALAAYFLGNLSPSILMAKARGIDIKKEGSGNAGTTNALRVLGKKGGSNNFSRGRAQGRGSVASGRPHRRRSGRICMRAGCFRRSHMAGNIQIQRRQGCCNDIRSCSGDKSCAGDFRALGIVVIVVFITKRMSIGSITGAVSFPFLSMIFGTRIHNTEYRHSTDSNIEAQSQYSQDNPRRGACHEHFREKGQETGKSRGRKRILRSQEV